MYKAVLAEVPGSVPNTQSSQPSVTPILGDLTSSSAGSALNWCTANMQAKHSERKMNLY